MSIIVSVSSIVVLVLVVGLVLVVSCANSLASFSFSVS